MKISLDALGAARTGLSELDGFFGDGIPRCRVVGLFGPRQEDVTEVGLSFLAEGLRGGEICWYLSTGLSAEEVHDRLRHMGVTELEESGLIIVDASRSRDVADLFPRLAGILAAHRGVPVRGVLDSWTDLYFDNIVRRRRLLRLSIDLFNLLRYECSTSLVCFKVPMDTCTVNMVNIALKDLVEIDEKNKFILHRIRETPSLG